MSVEATAPPAANRRGDFARLFVLLATGLFTALLVAVLSRYAPKPARVPFDATHLRSMRSQRPDVVIIGNSMVYTRLAESLLDDLVKPTRVKIISRGGTQSAIWYAQLKNYVVASGVKVKRVILFFRDRELTLGRARTQGPFSGNLQRAMPGADPVIDAKLAEVPEGALDHVRIALGKVVPVGRLREFMATRADTLAMRLAGLGRKRRSAILEKKAINAVFEVESLRDVDAERMASWDDERPFAEGVKDGFLPDMIELARNNGIELTFVRVRRRRTAAGRPDSPEVAAYMNDLRRYLKKQHVGFIDQSNARWESLELYGNGDHIAPRYRLQYTRLFVKYHPELFKLP